MVDISKSINNANASGEVAQRGAEEHQTKANTQLRPWKHHPVAKHAANSFQTTALTKPPECLHHINIQLIASQSGAKMVQSPQFVLRSRRVHRGMGHHCKPSLA
jgi:hypothetical protein